MDARPRCGTPPETGYVLEGSLLDALPVAAAWHIRRGHIDGVDVSDQVVVVLPATTVARLVLLDEQATPEQVLVLVDAVGGRLGGPLAAPAVPVTGTFAFSQVPITCRVDHERGVVSVPHRFRLVFRLDPDRGASASEIRIHLPEHDLVRAARDVPASYREFRFVHDRTTDDARKGW